MPFLAARPQLARATVQAEFAEPDHGFILEVLHALHVLSRVSPLDKSYAIPALSEAVRAS